MSSSIKSIQFPYFGFKAGKFYFYQWKGSLSRIHSWPHLVAEARDENANWHELSISERDNLMDDIRCSRQTFEHRPARGVFWCKHTGQGCFPWTLGRWDRSGAYAEFHWQQWLANVPPLVIKQAYRLPCDQLSAIDLFRRCPSTLDLVPRDRILATALARHWEFNPSGLPDWSGLAEVAHRKRRDLLGWLGFPPTTALANGLRSVFIRRRGFIHLFREAVLILMDPRQRRLVSKYRFLNGALISFLAHPKTHTWFCFSEHHPLAAPRSPLSRVAWHFSSINQLLDHDLIDVDAARSIAKWGRRKFTFEALLPYLKSHEFSIGPNPDRNGVEQLQCAADLVKEGAEMENCLGSIHYFIEAVTGRLALYRITRPVRATLSLKREPDGWRVCELRGPRNEDISPKAIEQIVESFPIGVRALFDYNPVPERNWMD